LQEIPVYFLAIGGSLYSLSTFLFLVLVVNLQGIVKRHIAQNPLDTFSRSFPVDREVANLLQTC